jgi:virginiamycin B lyase
LRSISIIEHPAGTGPYGIATTTQGQVFSLLSPANAILRFDPKTEKFESFPPPDTYASVRQLAGRNGEVWGAESAADKRFVIKGE